MKATDPTLRLIDQWTGHAPEPPDRMKHAFIALLLLVLALAILGLSSCATVTTKTTVTDPKSGLVTVTETTTTTPDAASVRAVADTAQAYAPPRGIVIEVHPDK